MNRAGLILGFVFLGALVWVTARGSLPNYLSLLGI
jgi:hypothetical protein